MCGQFVERSPSHACLASQASHLLHHAELLLSLCTSESLMAALDAGSHLSGAAEQLSAEQHCTAVAWSLQASSAVVHPPLNLANAPACLHTVALHNVPIIHALSPAQLSIGLMLPTLLVWRAQLSAARRLCQDAPSGPQRLALQREYEHSMYCRLCQPVLHAVGLGGWWVPMLAAALGGYQAGRLCGGGGGGGGE